MSTLLSKRKTKRTVVLLCTGDTCRGPMAQGYMRHALEEKGIKYIDVKTAGVMTIPGLIPTPEAAQVLANQNIDISQHRSSPLTPELIHKADIILGMTPFHVQFALRESEEAKNKTFLLKEFAESDIKNYQITDPMGMTLEVYKRVYREMKLAIDKMIEAKDFFREPPVEDLRRIRTKRAEDPSPAPVVAPPAPASVTVKPGAKKPAPSAPAAKNGSKPAAKPAPAPSKNSKTVVSKPVAKTAAPVAKLATAKQGAAPSTPPKKSAPTSAPVTADKKKPAATAAKASAPAPKTKPAKK